MKWTVMQLQKFRDNGLLIDQVVDVAEDLKKRDPEIRGVSPIHLTGNAEIDTRKVTFHLHLTGSLILPCSRTLEDVDFPVDIRSTETFLLKSGEVDMFQDDEIHEPEGGIVDLLPIIEELLLLEIPIQVFSNKVAHNDDLPVGNDWEVMTEEQYKQEQQKEKIDPRLAGLADLLKNKTEE